VNLFTFPMASDEFLELPEILFVPDLCPGFPGAEEIVDSERAEVPDIPVDPFDRDLFRIAILLLAAEKPTLEEPFSQGLLADGDRRLDRFRGHPLDDPQGLVRIEIEAVVTTPTDLLAPRKIQVLFLEFRRANLTGTASA
jgi:hypothetical protein